MPKPRISKSMPQHAPRKRPDMDSRHLANVRQIDCVMCGASYVYSGTHPHHLLRTGEQTNQKSGGRTSADKWAIPLCPTCHRGLHDLGDEEGYLAAAGIDGRALAQALWGARGDLEAMRRVAFRANQEARLKLRPNA